MAQCQAITRGSQKEWRKDKRLSAETAINDLANDAPVLIAVVVINNDLITKGPFLRAVGELILRFPSQPLP
jgi:hypothetical protein